MIEKFLGLIKLFRSWPLSSHAGDIFDNNSSGNPELPTPVPSWSHHHRSYAPYPSHSTYAPNILDSAMRLLSFMVFVQFNRHPSHFPLGRPPREIVYAEVGIDVTLDSNSCTNSTSPHPSRPTTPSADGQDIPGPSWTSADLASPFPYPSYPPLPDWHHSPPIVETLPNPSIPGHPGVSSLSHLPVTQMDPSWPDINSPSIGATTQSASSSPRHSPFRDTPTAADLSEGGSKGRKRSRGRYRKEDPADRYLRESTEDGNRLWTCMWTEPSHGTPNSPAAQNICGHQAPKSNARQHVKSRHLKLRCVNFFCHIFYFFSFSPTAETHASLSVPKIPPRLRRIGHMSAQNAAGPGATKAHGITTESASTVMSPKNPRSGSTTTLRWKPALLRIPRI